MRPNQAPSGMDIPPVPVEPADDLADAHKALGYFGTWINSADTKAGLLSAALAVVIAAVTQQRGAVADVVRPANGGELAALCLLGLLGAFVIVALVALARAITPRTQPSDIPSRFGFPTVAFHGWKHLPATRAQAAEEAWSQAHALAGIAATKNRAVRMASVAVFTTLPLYVSWSVVASLID